MTSGKSRKISRGGYFSSGPERLAAADSRRRSCNDVQEFFFCGSINTTVICMIIKGSGVSCVCIKK